MAAINEAWEVLGDPARRAAYDASLRASVPSPSGGPVARPSEPDDEDDDVDLAEDGHARWAIGLPWILVLGVLAVIFVFTAFAARFGGDGDSPTPSGPRGELIDGLVEVGSCIRLDDAARAVEVSCAAAHVGIVRAVAAAAAPCPLHTEGFYDQSGSKLICIARD
jgi:curved DNA-binding protein CbpA